MTYSNFVDVDDLKSNSPILQYVNSDELSVFIKPAQDIYIGRYLGRSFYYHLMNNLNTNTLSSDEEQLLIEYIFPAETWWITHEFALYSNYKFTNKSMSKQSSDNSTPAELVEVNFVISNIRDKAEYFTDILIRHLKDNYQKYPEYYQFYMSFENTPADTTPYFSGIYIPDRWNYENCSLKNVIYIPPTNP